MAVPWSLVTFDIDGTLTTRHGWWPIAQALGKLPDYNRTNRALRSGRETEDVHLEKLFALATGVSRSRFEALLAASPRVAGIEETVRSLRAEGTHVALLSHNAGPVLDWYRRAFGFEAGSGGWGLAYADGHVAAPREVRADKVRGLADLAARFRVPYRSICHVGDAWPDARLAPILGGFVAFNPKGEAVAEVADAVVRGRDLRRVVPVLERLVPRRPVKGARPLAESSNTANGAARASGGWSTSSWKRSTRSG